MTGLGNASVSQVLGYFFSFFLLVVGDQTYYQRFFASRDKKSVNRALLVWIIATAFVMPMVALGACTARALYPDIEAGQALMHLAGNGMPTLIGAVMIATIAAFIITTGNSFLLSCSVNLSWDVYTRLAPSATDKQKLMVCRFGVLGLSVLGYLMITLAPNILAMQMYAYTMYGAAISPALLGAIMWDKATKEAGLASMICGAVLTLLWEFLGKPYGLGSVLVAAPVALIVLVAVGNITYKGLPNPLRAERG
jgi:Na+/proline symporter